MKYTDEQASDISNIAVRDYGILMHRAFSLIATPADVDAAIEKLVYDGFLANNTIQRDELKLLLDNALKQPGVSEWFDGSWQLLTEVDLLMPSGSGGYYEQLRPDRVMFRNNEVVIIDYKFGINKQPQHIRQVENYVACIKQMGYEKVAGYCWYITLGQIELIGKYK